MPRRGDTLMYGPDTKSARDANRTDRYRRRRRTGARPFKGEPTAEDVDFLIAIGMTTEAQIANRDELGASTARLAEQLQKQTSGPLVANRVGFERRLKLPI